LKWILYQALVRQFTQRTGKPEHGIWRKIMDVTSFQTFLNHQIHLFAEKLGDEKHSSNDGVSLGTLMFYLAVRQSIDKKASEQDLGLVGAFNDTLQALGLIGKGQTFISKLDD
jgi:hypothetical protein